MKEIPLSQGQVALVDDEDYEQLSRFKWFALFQSGVKGFYAVRKISKSQREQGHTEQMHRRILGLRLKDGKEVDHINHNTLDNRRTNIRVVSRRENHWNRSNQSKFGAGVYQHGKRFRAMVHFDGKIRHLGVYDSPDEARGSVACFLDLHRSGPDSDL